MGQHINKHRTFLTDVSRMTDFTNLKERLR